MIEVRVYDPETDIDSLVGYFPPAELSPLVTAMENNRINVDGETCEDECWTSRCETGFIIGFEKTYFQIIINHPEKQGAK